MARPPSKNKKIVQKAKKAEKTEVFRLIAKKMLTENIQLTKRWLGAIVEVIADELILSGIISVEHLGTFYLCETGGYYRSVTENGITTRRYIEPQYTIKYNPSRVLKEVVNGKRILGATKKEQREYLKKMEKIKEQEEKNSRPTQKKLEILWNELQVEKELEKERLKKEKEDKLLEEEIKIRNKHKGKRIMKRG